MQEQYSASSRSNTFCKCSASGSEPPRTVSRLGENDNAFPVFASSSGCTVSPHVDRNKDDCSAEYVHVLCIPYNLDQSHDSTHLVTPTPRAGQKVNTSDLHGDPAVRTAPGNAALPLLQGKARSMMVRERRSMLRWRGQGGLPTLSKTFG